MYSKANSEVYSLLFCMIYPHVLCCVQNLFIYFCCCCNGGLLGETKVSLVKENATFSFLATWVLDFSTVLFSFFAWDLSSNAP